MVLKLPFETFASEVKGLVPRGTVYCKSGLGRLIVTAADPAREVLVQSETTMTRPELEAHIAAAGLSIVDGQWMVDEEAVETDHNRPVWVAAVAYHSHESTAGVWVEAFYHEPSHGEVLSRFDADLRDGGYLADVAPEELERLAMPNITIISPSTLQLFATESESAPYVKFVNAEESD